MNIKMPLTGVKKSMNSLQTNNISVNLILTHTTDLKGPHEPANADRQSIKSIAVKQRRHNFREVLCGYSDVAAYKEASRCLRCDLENKEFKGSNA